MIVYDIVTALCFAMLTAFFCYVLISIIVKKREERINFIRSFRKGKCITIFIVSIPLLFMGYRYSGATLIECFFSTVSHVIDFVLLKFGLAKLQALMQVNLLYKITVYYCSILLVLNAVMFVFAFIDKELWQLKNSMMRLFTKKEKLLIFGYNPNNVSVYNSNKKSFASIIDDFTKQDALELYKKNIRFISTDDNKEIVSKIVKNSLDNKDYTIVVNTENDELNLSLCSLFVKEIELLKDEQKQSLFNHLRIYVLGNPALEAIYGDIVLSSFGCIRYKNKYQMIAMDFVDKYPFTQFMDKRHIDYTTSLIKPEVDINVCLIGFGKPNREIFSISVANNQFLTADENGVNLKKVNYHIFDKEIAKNNKNLNHLYYRFKSECANLNPSEYLPMPSLPANEEFHHLDINEPSFYNAVRKIITGGKNAVNFIIVSFDNDLENIDLAQKLVEKRREWGVEDTAIFVRVKRSHKNQYAFKEDGVYFIGDENQCVYDINRITNDKIFKMAQMRNEIYGLEYAITTKKDLVLNPDVVSKNREIANFKWFKELSQIERESNLYCCLSLQSKLNLIGLKYCMANENDDAPLSESQYFEYYAKDDMPDTETYNLNVEGKKVVNYTLDYKKSKRGNLAILEHYRWNSYMLSKGVIPASKEQILNEKVIKKGKEKHSNGKNYHLRRHGNLTTFEGLVEFRKLIAERDKTSERDCDVIKYDYQLLDDAYWLLTKNGYKIIKRS